LFMAETTQNDARKKRGKPPWRKAFLANLSRTGSVTAAAQAAGVERKTVYRHREHHPDFAAQWESRLEEFADHLEEVAIDRATRGVQRFRFYKGKPLPHPLLCQCGHSKVDHGQGPCSQEGCRCPSFAGAPYAEQEPSDTLLIFLLKGARPEKYMDNLGLDAAQIDAYIERRVAEMAQERVNQIISRNGTAPPPPVTASQGNVLPDSGLASPAAGSPAPGPLSQEGGPEPVHPEEFPRRPPWLPPEGFPPQNQAGGP
jgi:hypothetical protein